jgi:cephalosporin hydroxylase
VTPTLSVIVPTAGRPTLSRTLASISPQLLPGDELLVDVNLDGDVGQAARNRCTAKAASDWIGPFVDDDDILAPGALAVIRAAVVADPLRMHLFRMRNEENDTVVWGADREIREGNVGSAIVVVPRVPLASPHNGEYCGPLWGDRYEGDFDFIVGCAELLGEPVWHEDVIQILRPKRDVVDASTIAQLAITEHSAIQRVGELSELLTVLRGERPRVIIEVGSYAGGTVWAFAKALEGLGERPLIISVDQDHHHFDHYGDEHTKLATLITGDSHSQAIREQVAAAIPGDGLADFLFVDGDHTEQGAWKDYEDYRKLVRPGGLIGFHDISPQPGAEVDRLWASLSMDPTATTIEIYAGLSGSAGIGLIRVDPAV